MVYLLVVIDPSPRILSALAEYGPALVLEVLTTGV
jgi:hypothetical protein